jgi:hypothetical protein
MRLRSHLIQIASSAVLAGAFAGSNALAQGNAPTSPSTGSKAGQTSTQQPATKGAGAQTAPQSATGSQPTTKGAGAAAPSAGPWTANNVTAQRPFGDINVSSAGTTTETVRTWAQQRSPAERAEISGRCTVITNAGNASRYPADAQQFCRNYMMVASANPPSGKGPTTTR